MFMPTPARLEAAIDRLRRSRLFTKQFLSDLSAEEWFWSPREFTTHLAWQVGHLAVAQYNLCLRRIRGRTAEDEDLISDRFFEAFKLGSKPVPGAQQNLPLEEIQRVFDAVHQQVLTELPLVDNAELDAPVERPHPAFKTKLGAIEWCPQHEFVHAGQIAMLRRLMGKAPLR
jgi:DinB superfamily